MVDSSLCHLCMEETEDCWNYGSLTIEMVAILLSKIETSIIKDGGFKYGDFKLSKIWPPTTIHFFFLVR